MLQTTATQVMLTSVGQAKMGQDQLFWPSQIQLVSPSPVQQYVLFPFWQWDIYEMGQFLLRNGVL